MDGDAGFEKWEIVGLFKSRICPRRLVTSQSVAWINLFNHYRAGHLAVGGGIVDQPAIYLHVMELIGSAWSAQ